MAKLNLQRNLSSCKHATNVCFFVGDSRARIDDVVAHLNDPGTKTDALRELESMRDELASVAKLWASAQILGRILISSGTCDKRLARRALGLWLSELPAVAFPNISNATCRLLAIPRSVRAEAVASRPRLADQENATVIRSSAKRHAQVA